MGIGRNDPCYCGSGKKFKKCCLNKEVYIPEPVLRELLKEQVPEPNLNLVPSIVWKGYRWRAIWNKMYHRPINETFHEFLINVLLWTLGKEWHEKEINTDPEERHIIMKWLFLYSDWQKTTHIPPDKKPWIKDINNMLDKYSEGTPENPDLFNALIVTNFSYYYGGNTGISPTGDFTVVISKHPKTPLMEIHILDEIIHSLNLYNKIPEKL